MQVKNIVAVAVQANLPVLIWGEPGTGKTSFIYQLGKALDVPTKVVIAALHEPADFGGWPVPEDQKAVRFLPPSWAYELLEKGKGILFLDEISTAPPAVQAALLRVVLERTIGEFQLPSEVRIVAAANPPDQAAGGWELAAPLANRFLNLDWKVDHEAWVGGIMSGFQNEEIPLLPENWTEKINQKLIYVTSYIASRSTALLQMPKRESELGRAWPSPRSWELAAKVWAATDAAGLTEDEQIASLSAAVGEGQAIEFWNYVQHLDIPSIEQIMKDPEHVPLPERDDSLFAMSLNIAEYAISKKTPKPFQAAWTVYGRMASIGKGDIPVIAIRRLAQELPENFRKYIPISSVEEFLPILKEAGLLGG